MPVLTITVTNAGRAALVNAQNTGTLPVTIAQCGISATAVTPTPSATALAGEAKRIATIAGDVVADDTIHVVVKDEGSDAYTVRSFALYLADGTLFAIYGGAAPIVEKTAQSTMLLAIDIKFADIAAASLTFGDISFINPPATETVKGVAEIATQDETDAGTDDTRFVTPKKLWTRLSNWLASWGADIWRASNDGSGSGLDADLLDGKQAVEFAWLDGSRIFTGPLQVAATNQAYFKLGASTSPTVIHRNDGNGYHILLSDPSASINPSFNTLRPFHIDLSNGWLTSTNGQTFSGGTNVSGALTLNGAGVWSSANDGAGSGMDADLLDGQDGSWYADITGRLGYKPVQQGTGVGQLGNIVKIGWAGTRLKATVDTTDQGNFVFDTHVLDVWRASNDGSGSGLDADMLDGKHATSFAWLDGSKVFTGPVQVTATNVALFKGNTGASQTVIHRVDGSSYHFLLSDVTESINSTFNAFRPLRIDLATGRLGSENGQNFSGGTYVTGSLSLNGAGVWSAGNDGSGSGLDADLLRGLTPEQVVNALRIVAGLGYTPANRAGDSFTGAIAAVGVTITGGDLFLSRTSTPWGYIIRPNVAGYRNLGFTTEGAAQPLDQVNFDALSATVRTNLIWHAGNDGAGSGMDSDLLRGLTPEQVVNATRIVSGLGFTPVQQGTGVGQLGNAIKIGWSSGARLKATVDSSDLGSIVFDNNISDVWRASNDGAGSGLDADLLDGYQGSAYERIASESLGANGYTIYASGKKECWGSLTIGAQSIATVTLPVTHTSWFNVALAPFTKPSVDAQNNTALSAKSGVESFTIRNWENIPIQVDWRTTGV